MNLSLSSSSLKLVAVATMLIDHVGFLFFPEAILWRIVGRISFPLFAFLIAEGYRRTSDVKHYAFRLFLFALVSQLPFMLFLRAAGIDEFALNIFFTLFAGLIALRALRLRPQYGAPVVVGICIIAELLHFDYGAYGVLTILGSYLFLIRRTLGGALLILLPFFEMAITLLRGSLFPQAAAALSFPFITLYNGERGRPLPRYLLYWFYPAHMLLLWFIWLSLR